MVRNGYLPQREVLTGIGPVTVQVPKVRDRSDEGTCFRSGLVPRYVRRARTVEAALPWQYLKGVSTGNMQDALTALLGEQARGIERSEAPRSEARAQTRGGRWGAGLLGALEEVFPETRHLRCWVHKSANVLNYLPRAAPRARRCSGSCSSSR